MDIIVLLLILVTSLGDPGLAIFNPPHIKTRNGNIYFEASPYKNISFFTSWDAGVTINEVDVLSILDKADQATKLLDNYHKSFSPLSDRLDALELRMSSGLDANITNSNVPAMNRIRLRRIFRRINALQRRLGDIQILLYKDECVSNPCKNGGVCQDSYNNYFCKCQQGWEGHDCLEDVNECNRFAGTDLGCQNGATCLNKPGSYECLCQSGFVGLHCTRRKADCSLGGTELCGHGICVNQNNQEGYKCICDQGWKTDGVNPACTVDVDECNEPHLGCSKNPKVQCKNIPGSFFCGHCPAGYTGNGYTCEDIDECAINNGGCSLNPMVPCINTPGSSNCGLCPPGYSGNGISCIFLGVCNVNNGGCHHLAQCRDNPIISSSYVDCICPRGYIGNGRGPSGCIASSLPFNPCTSNPCVNGDCTVNNVTRDYVCNCRRRYTGRNCDIVKDPCASNPCLNDGTCQNIGILTFRCTCKTGYIGRRCDREAQGCGGVIRQDSGTLKYPTDDFLSYGHSVSCAWVIETNSTKVLNITFRKFDVEETVGCRADWLQIHDGKSSASRALGKFCGNKLPLGGNILTTHNVIYLWFRSNARIAKDGFELAWNSTNPVCGGNFMLNISSYGTIESPGSPDDYPPNRDCYWSLLVPYGKRVYFHIFSLEIGDNNDCSKDYLEFYSSESTDDEIIARFCNSSNPSPIYSTEELVYVHFHSDSQNSYPGFRLSYSVVGGISGCGNVFTLSDGTIQSSEDITSIGYMCEYKIQQPFKAKIKITFTRFELADSPGCSVEYVKVYEGPNEESPLMGRYCGKNLPSSFLSVSNQVLIVSHLRQTTNGWKLSYKRVCGFKYTEPTGEIKMPDVSTTSKNCIIQIERPLGSVINLVLKVTTVDSIFSYKCFYSHVTVRNGDNENSPLIGQYCSNTSEIITSTFNHLYIEYKGYQLYKNGSTYLSPSFTATYSSVDIGCGGVLRNKMGNIASPSQIGGFYPSQTKCKWVIIAPPNNVIQLTWMSFNVEQSYECVYDNVEVYDNSTGLGKGDLMGRYCGFSLPPVLITLSNIMTIIFSTDISINMDGFLASYIFIHESNVCGGNYHTSSGQIKSLKYPEFYPTSRECVWTITVPTGQQIMLNVTDFSVEPYTGCRYDFLEIRNGGTSASPLIGKYCGENIPKLIPSHTNKLYLFFKSDLSRTSRGFKINWSSTETGCGGKLTSSSGSIISPNYPEPYNRNTECSWQIIISAGSLIQIVFSDINLEQHSLCLADYVEIFDGLTANSNSIGKYCSEVSKQITSTGNQVLIKFRADAALQGRGFQLHYTTVCHNTLKGFHGVIESPNYSGRSFPQNQDCLWDIIVSDHNKINITFSEFDLDRSLALENNTCKFDYVEILYEVKNSDYEQEANTYNLYDTFCGSKPPGLISLDSDHARIHFVSDNLLTGTGFRLEWQIYGCGGILRQSSGTIQSPNYPKPYPAAVKCEWQIEVQFGSSIMLNFTDVDIEKDSSCNFDYIKIYNGLNSSYTLLIQFCKQERSTVITSTGNFMFIEFKADESYQGKGFTATYVTHPTKCGGLLTANEGNIFSPNYPKNYDKNDTCFWLIDVEETHSVVLNFKDVDLIQSQTCKKNYVKVYDGPTEAYPVLEKVCGNVTPNQSIVSTFNEMFVEFRSSEYQTSKGFMAKYIRSCGSRITTQGTGVIRSAYDDFNDYETNCTWTIVATDPSLHVRLTISHIQLRYAYCYDEKGHINIYSGESVTSPLLGSYCGSKVPPTLVSDGNAITVSLESEVEFFATYSVLDSHCGGTLTSSEGYFATPGYPKEYASNIQCEWTLHVAAGNHITLSFIYFHLRESENCNTDYLEIRRNNASGSLLGLYCGENKPINITHEGSLWLVYKGSKDDTPSSLHPLPADLENPVVTPKGFYGEYTLVFDNELRGSRGIIESPMYPNKFYDYGVFSWRITVGIMKKILLTFKEFYVESDDNDCYITSIEIYDGVDQTANRLHTFCGVTIPDPIRSSTNVLYIKAEYNSFRFGTKFVMEWLEINKPLEITSIIRNNTSGECSLPGGEYILQVNKSFTIQSPGYPRGYKPNLKCEWIFYTQEMNHLKIYFLDFSLADTFSYLRSSVCMGDYISLYKNSATETRYLNNENWELIRTICTKNNSYDVIESTNWLKIEFVTNMYINGTGFKAKITEACGGSLTGSTGHIIFSNSSLLGYECQWNITVGSGKTIELTFEEMNIAHNKQKGCNNYLMIRNGKFADSPFLGKGKYCGTEKPSPLESTGNHLYIKYKGTSNIVGFKLKYQQKSVVCGGEVILTESDNSTDIFSPNYDNIPPSYSECSWVIRAPPGESLRIDFVERFDLTSRNECDLEYVEVRDGGTEYSPLIGKFCKQKPSTQFSTGNMIFVKFFTQAEDPKNGFKAIVSLATCGGTLRGFSGEIRHPQSPSNTKKFNCTWHIEGTPGHFLKISFTILEVKKIGKCLPTNILAITEKDPVFGNVTSLGQFCGKTLPSMIQSSDNKVTINFVGNDNDKFALKFETSKSECGGELRVDSGVIQSPGYPVMGYFNRNCAWKIIVPEGRRITIEILDLDFDGGVYNNHQGIVIYEGISVKTPIATLRAGASKSKYESSSNKMTVFFWSFHNTEHRGFKANFSSNNPTICSGDFNNKNGVITQPSARNYSYHCEWAHNASPFLNETLAITIGFKQNSNVQNKVYRYFTFFIIKERNQNILARLYPTSKQPVTIRSPYITTNIIAHTNSENQLNFSINYKTHQCGGMIKGKQEGTITSPNFPNQPTDSFECAWLINANKEEQIKITVTDINFGDDCEKNFLIIFNGWSRLHPRIGQYCKNNKPEPFTSQAKSLFIEYKWEKQSGGTGFKLNFEAIADGCGGIYHDELSTIQTPNYGKEYPINSECLWEIRSDPGYHIEFHFIDRFYIEEADNCTNDYVEIWDWKNDDWVSFGRKCGRNISEIFKSSGEKMKVLFRSNDRIGASGFKARWEWKCGGTFEATKTPRYIVSPRYPLNYRANMKCVYKITTKSNVMVLKFEDFELAQGDSDCSFDNLTISSNQMTAYSRARNIYCGKNKPPIFRIMKDVIVTFNSYKYFMSRKGFKFMYSDESCGGIINTPAVIETPKYNYVLTGIIGYPKVKCFWNITAPPKQVVILKVTILKLLGLSYSRICFGEKLTVYNGLTTKSSNHLISLCGDVMNYPPIIAESGKMFVELDASPYSFKGFRAEVYFSHGPEEGCGGTVNLTETKFIQSPDLSNLDCGWKIIAPRDYRIRIQFTEVNIPGSCSDADKNSVLCGCSFVEVHDGGSAQSDSIIKLCNTSNSQIENRMFTTSGNNAFIRFTLMDKKSNVFKVTLTPILSDCGPSVLNVTQEIKILTSPHYPSKYLSNTRCFWMFYAQNTNEKIQLHFVDFDLSEESAIQSNNDTCAGDKIEINEGFDKRLITEGLGPGAVHRGQSKSVLMHFNNFLTKHTFCSTGDSPFDYYSSGTSLGLSFVSTDSLKKGSGFKLEYSLAGCSRNYTDLQGRFLNINKRLNCIITITVPQNRTISLYFQIFFMYHISPNCSEGAFEVRENNSTGTILSKECGMRLPSPIFSFTNKIYIHVWSTRYMPFSRYDVIYTSTDVGRGCGGDIFNFKGKFSSPLYPNEFRNDTLCTWKIKVPANLQAVLQFIDFDVQGECYQSYVKVITYSDGVDRESTFCKNDKPAIIRSSNNLIEIKYYSSIHNVGKGWMAAFQGVSNDITELL